MYNPPQIFSNSDDDEEAHGLNARRASICGPLHPSRLGINYLTAQNQHRKAGRPCPHQAGISRAQVPTRAPAAPARARPLGRRTWGIRAPASSRVRPRVAGGLLAPGAPTLHPHPEPGAARRVARVPTAPERRESKDIVAGMSPPRPRRARLGHRRRPPRPRTCSHHIRPRPPSGSGPTTPCSSTSRIATRRWPPLRGASLPFATPARRYSLPSSALGRRRQPPLARFWACALARRRFLLSRQLRFSPRPAPASPGERASARERAGRTAHARTRCRKGAGPAKEAGAVGG